MQIQRYQNSADEKMIKVSFDIKEPTAGSFLDWETLLAKKQAEATRLATGMALECLDTDGQPVIIQGIKWTRRGKEKRIVETIGGPYELYRNVYQTNAGGATRAPVDERAALLGTSTPRFAKIVSSKIAEMPAAAVSRDMIDSHERSMTHSFAQDLACVVSRQAASCDAHMAWEPTFEKEGTKEKISLIAIGMDSATVRISQPHPTEAKKRQISWRMGHCLTISFYDNKGTYLDSLCLGSGPGQDAPAGKTAFFLEAEGWVDRVKEAFPGVHTIGLSDAAPDIEEWIGKRVDDQGIDFYHACEYLGAAAPALVHAHWAEESHDTPEILAGALREHLRDQPGGAEEILGWMRDYMESHGHELSKTERAGLQSAITYFTNHHHLMNYATWRAKHWPIGSGVTESACKGMIKQRLCQRGMQWRIATVDEILSLRALYHTPSRWEAFWAHHELMSKLHAM